MNEYVLIGIVIVGTIIVLGGGSWIMRILSGGKKDTAAKG